MIRWFLGLLYGSVPAKFESDFDLEKSVQRLSATTVSSVLSAFARQSLAKSSTSNRRVVQQAESVVLGVNFVYDANRYILSYSLR